MTPNAVAFYAIAVLIVLAAGAAVGLPSLRHAGYAGAALIVLMALLEIVSWRLCPGSGAARRPRHRRRNVVTLVLRREAYRGLLTVPHAPERFWIAAPIAVGTAAVLVVTFVARRHRVVPGEPADPRPV